MNESLYTKFGVPGDIHLEEVTKHTSRDGEVFITGHVTFKNSRGW